MKTPESYEKAEIKTYLKSLGTRCWYFMPQQAGFGLSGVPDIIACINGRFYAIEVKRPGKLPTLLQDKRMQEIKAAGGYALWGTAEKVIKDLNDYLDTLVYI